MKKERKIGSRSTSLEKEKETGFSGRGREESCWENG
jgi:hypothetical protein